MIQDIEGVRDLSKFVQAADIPTELNKAYEFPLGDEGGVGAKLGKIFDPVAVIQESVPNPDEAGVGKPFFPLIGIVAVGFILYAVLRKP